MSAESDALHEQIKQSVALLRSIFDWDAAQARLAELNHRSETPRCGTTPPRRRR